MEEKDFSNLTIVDIRNIIKENERLKKENEALKNKSICDDDNYIVYVKKCETGRIVRINGTAAEISNSIRQIISRFSETSGLPFNLILSAVSMAQNIFGKGE
ncbi:MAG: hypothetical protein ACI4YB_01765 [Oscillospiraceae bacterium]